MPMRVVRRTMAPIVRFIHVESAGGMVLLVGNGGQPGARQLAVA